VFIYLLMQYVFPKDFRRARDYGFLHGNAKMLLKIIQWILRVHRPELPKKTHNTFACPCRGAGMVVSGIKPTRVKPG
jgi:hypothetical protein